jgi:hypothetical protein
MDWLVIGLQVWLITPLYSLPSQILGSRNRFVRETWMKLSVSHAKLSQWRELPPILSDLTGGRSRPSSTEAITALIVLSAGL